VKQTKGGVDPRLQEVAAAAALAGHYFPQQRDDGTLYVRLSDVVFLLSGHLGLWSAWASLPRDEQELITRLLRLRDSDLANVTVVGTILRRSAAAPWPGLAIPIDGPIDEIGLTFGRPPLEMARQTVEILAMEKALDSGRVVPIAFGGAFAAPLFRGKDRTQTTVIPVGYQLGGVGEPDVPKPIDIGEPADAETLNVDLAELRNIADQLDTTYGTTYRRESLNKILDHLEAQPGHQVTESWQLSAGMMQILHAPTGFGKSVLTELLACWSAQHGQVMTVLVATNAGVIKTAHAITRHFEKLGLEGQHAVPLTSPTAAQQAAETAISGDSSENGSGQWAVKTMAYGCALPSAATAEAVDAWEPGREPCTTLRSANGDDGSKQRHTCPWLAGCGKFRNVRAACTSNVVVTTFSNWLMGVVQVPVTARGHERHGMTVEELLLHRSHLVLVDEVDEFQANMIKGQAGKIVLAHHRPDDTPLRRISAELPRARRGIDGAIRGDAYSATGLAMHLAENYVEHLASGDFHKLRRTRPKHQPLLGRWMLPRKWDGILTATLSGLNEDEQATQEQYEQFHALFDPSAAVDLPEWLKPIRAAIAMIQVNNGEDVFAPARALIAAALAESPHPQLSDDALRARTTDRILRRAYFGRLRELLTTFIYVGPNLSAAGVASAREISDKLRRYKEWRAAPLGPLGRTLFAFSEVYDEDRPDDTALNVNAFGGDPHTYVPTIGETTALAHVGRRRCVLGLSATSFLPGAPHHHVFVTPTWWVPDSFTGGFDLRAAPVPDESQKFIRISGTSGRERREAMTNLGFHMWTKQLEPELRLLAARPETATRQRLLLATTSYEGAEDLARGISRAGVTRDQIVLAVRPNDVASTSAEWQTLPADQLERFGREVDGKVLIAPLARAARGINMADDDGRSLVGSVWLVVRPVPIIDEPAEILAHVHAAIKDTEVPSHDPGGRLEIMKNGAAKLFDELFTTLPYFSHLPREARRSITAENLIGLIQLAGRTRRGGTHGRIHLVDAAFHEAGGDSDLPHLIQDLRREWERHHAHPLPMLESLYGDTLTTIFKFADERTQGTDDWDDDHDE
jgi:hypothetical protein